MAAAALLSALMPGLAKAQGDCSTVLTRSALRSIFTTAGSVCVCGAPGASRPNLEWNETHVGGASGIIYEKGMASSGRGDEAGTYQVGGASDTAPGILHYDYAGGGSFNWAVDASPSGTTYQFCTPDTPHAPAFRVNMKSGICGADC
jgi:hypothetical protein